MSFVHFILNFIPMMGWKGCCGVHKLAYALVLVGALNWGLVGVFDWNLVTELLGSWPTVERVVYIVVGVSALVSLSSCWCKMCKK